MTAAAPVDLDSRDVDGTRKRQMTDRTREYVKDAHDLTF
jgi:hypothetical protein